MGLQRVRHDLVTEQEKSLSVLPRAFSFLIVQIFFPLKIHPSLNHLREWDGRYHLAQKPSVEDTMREASTRIHQNGETTALPMSSGKD